MKRLQAMVTSLEYEIDAQQMGISLTRGERREVFGDFVPEHYSAEAEERWGETEGLQGVAAQRRFSHRSRYRSCPVERRRVPSSHHGGELNPHRPAGGSDVVHLFGQPKGRNGTDTWHHLESGRRPLFPLNLPVKQRVLLLR